jgi:cytochrome c556
MYGSSCIHVAKMGNETGARAAEAGPFRGEAKKQKIVMKLPQRLMRILPEPTPFFREMFMVKPASFLKIVPALAVLVGFGTTMALAGPIEDRQAAMKQNGKAIGALAAIFKGESPYDAAVVKTNAEIIKQDFVKAFASFPPGSEKGPPETYAKPEIWSDPEGFKAAQETALKAVEALAATTDEAGFKTAMAGLGEACKGCHTKYRRPKE